MIRKGLVYVIDRVLAVQPNALTVGSTPMSLRGPGYRMPTSSLFTTLDAASPVNAEEVNDAVSRFYNAVAVTPTAVAFGGGFSEPLREGELREHILGTLLGRR